MKDFIYIVIAIILINLFEYFFFEQLEKSYVNRGVAAGYIKK